MAVRSPCLAGPARWGYVLLDPFEDGDSACREDAAIAVDQGASGAVELAIVSLVAELGADRVLFPGVGAAGAAMASLRERGLADPLVTAVGRGTPLLGICLGAQIILGRSDEDGRTDCLGLLPGTVTAFRPTDTFTKVPHMG